MKRLTKKQAAIIGLYTGCVCGNFSDIHKYAEEVYGCPILTHQFGDKKFNEKLRMLCKGDFLAICCDD